MTAYVKLIKMANKSKTYLLPFINDYIPIKFITLLEDTYIFFKKDYKICLLYKFSGKKSFIDYETELMSNEYFEKAIDIGVDKVIYIFHVPDDLFSIIDLFLEGKYSYLPEKNKIKDFLISKFNLRPNHRIFHILDRTKILKDELETKLSAIIPEGQDLASPPDIHTEEFNRE